MSKTKKILPELRFPEFKNEEEWNIEPLGDLSVEIVEKTKGRKYKLMSITSGAGLVSQIEKFGREIAGDSYKNYYVIQKGDFAYNRSSTKLYEEGEIAMYENEELGAVPNSIFTCFRFHQNKIYPPFAKYPFINNLHGNWLKKFIAVGARANGALQVNIQDLFSLPFPYPSIKEQKKIASFLSSLDEVITAHIEKLNALKNHKKGLMQNLFPQENEQVPKYRFKEYRNSGNWIVKKLNEVCEVNPSSKGLPEKFIYIDLESVEDGILKQKKHITINEAPSRAQRFLIKGDVIFQTVRPYQQNNYYFLPDDSFKYVASTGYAQLRAYESSSFLYQYVHNPNFLGKVLAKCTGSNYPAINSSDLSEITVLIPSKIQEQQKIASCLSALDEIIKAQLEKIEQLKHHKKGLMERLLPKAID